MDTATFDVEARIEADHWWFVGRRALFGARIAALRLDRGEPVLDVGTGTGANLRLLETAGFTRVTGIDASDVAIAYCREKGLGSVLNGDVTRLPFDDGRFGLVLATDVVEHVDDDAAAMAELTRVLKPGGAIILTVPAFASLWGLQDEVAQHKRRYRARGFRALVEHSGLLIEDAFYFNFVLFAPIWLARQVLKRVKPRIGSENEINHPLVNAILTRVFLFDVAKAGRWRPPFGVSFFVLARKPAI